MRFNIEDDLTASKLLNNSSFAEISSILKTFGEEKNHRKIAKSIINYVKQNKMNTTFDLRQSILEVIPQYFANKTMARVFQAIRIVVNNELIVLKNTLNKTANYLKKGGKLIVISYHSLEDRMVKNLFKKGDINGEVMKDVFGNIYKGDTKTLPSKSFQISSYEKVGLYGLRFFWEDGHNDGIYTADKLKSLGYNG